MKTEDVYFIMFWHLCDQEILKGGEIMDSNT